MNYWKEQDESIQEDFDNSFDNDFIDMDSLLNVGSYGRGYSEDDYQDYLSIALGDFEQ